jgi:hypothetical protein
MISKFTKQLKGAAILGALLMGSNAFAQLGLTWAEMGPNDVAGRCRSILVDKTDATGNKMYAAGVSGGVFKTTDAGANWSPVNDLAPSLIVSCMDMDASGTIYFGTGETFSHGGDGTGTSGFLGSGLYKFNSGSSTISLVQDSSLFGNINEIAVSSSTIYVASDKGLFISVNGGTSFTEEPLSFTSGWPAMDVKLAMNGDIYYSAGVKSASTSAVYYSAVGTSTYAPITPTVIANRGRIEIAPSPVDPNYVYLSIAKMKTTNTTTNGGLSAVMGSNNKGVNWTTISLGTAQFDPLSIGSKGIGDYANTIVADPTYKDAFYLGGDVYYQWSQIASNPTFGQGNWFQIGTNFNIPFAIYIHSAVHDVKFNSGNHSMYIATDGGIYKSVSNNSGFLPYNKGLNISQINSVTAPNFPRVATSTSTLAPYAGVSGGSIGNNQVYLPGYLNNDPMTSITFSTTFGANDSWQSDFSKIIPKALFYTGSNGTLLRTRDVESSNPPSDYNDVSYKLHSTGAGAIGSSTFANENTPFRLWENYFNGDSAAFVNEILTTSFVNTNKTKTVFTSLNNRPQMAGKYDTIIINMTSSKLTTPIPASQQIKIIPVYSGTTITSINVTGNTPSASSNTVYISSSLADSVRYTFSTAPNDSANISVAFKLRYDIGDVITLSNTDISGAPFNATVALTAPLATSVYPQGLPIIKVPLAKSGRVAAGTSGGTTAGIGPSVFAAKRPLNFSLTPDWARIAGKNSRVEGGTTNTPILGTVVTRLEWAPDGTSIYFSTKQNDTTFYLYRISHLEWLGDSASADYSGLLSSDLDSGGTYRRYVPQRTTPIGKFKNAITGIAITADNMNVMVTCGGYKNTLGTVYYSVSDARTLALNNTDASNFTVKNGTGLGNFPAYTCIFEKNDNKRALVGTETGIYSTLDITQASPAWFHETGGSFPNVPVFQLRQQTLPAWLCYNSGVIYAGTHGRGIWSTDKYFTPYAIGIQELGSNIAVASGIKVFPNPASDATNLVFNSSSEATYKVTVYDINGRTMIAENTGKLTSGQQMITLNTAQLTSGIYFVSVAGTNGFTANSKVVITH